MVLPYAHRSDTFATYRRAIKTPLMSRLDSYRATSLSRKAKIIDELHEIAERADEVILATDPDREGEAIAWHLAETIGLKKPKRIVFHEITEHAVQEALAHPRKIDEELVRAQRRDASWTGCSATIFRASFGKGPLWTFGWTCPISRIANPHGAGTRNSCICARGILGGERRPVRQGRITPPAEKHLR